MEYVYHMVPKEMKGDLLLSLNTLKEIYPELYETYTKKYFDHPDRKNLLSKSIPKLDCLWNDVIFLNSLHPYYVYKAFDELGIKVKKDLLFYKIPTKELKDNKNAIYFYRKKNFKGPAAEIPAEEIEVINLSNYPACEELPSDTSDYFKEEHSKGVQFGMFAYIPHIISLGDINISNASVINWSELPTQ